jgi:hypothetical protein
MRRSAIDTDQPARKEVGRIPASARVKLLVAVGSVVAAAVIGDLSLVPVAVPRGGSG